MRRRDLTAFEAPPEAAQTPADPPGRQPMTRITLSLPTPIADALRATAIRRSVGYRALILDAVEAAGTPVEVDRSIPPGRTQIPLNLPADDLATIDRSARRAGSNRSVFVTECLRRSLGPPGPR